VGVFGSDLHNDSFRTLVDAIAWFKADGVSMITFAFQYVAWGHGPWQASGTVEEAIQRATSASQRSFQTSGN
jgi:hypothetical protein